MISKATLAREIGNYFLQYIRVPRTRKNFTDRGRRHYDGYRIRHYHGRRSYAINPKTHAVIHHRKGGLLLRRPKSLDEFLYYYSADGANVPVFEHGKIKRDKHGNICHARIQSGTSKHIDRVLNEAFKKMFNIMNNNGNDSDNFPNKRGGC